MIGFAPFFYICRVKQNTMEYVGLAAFLIASLWIGRVMAKAHFRDDDFFDDQEPHWT